MKNIHIAKGARKRSAPFTFIEEAIDAVRAGTIVIVVDDEDRENEGDLTIAAEKVTPEAVNFMARFGRGLICLAMTPERLDELEIPLLVRDNTSRFETAFCTPIDAIGRTTTGISAHDRAATVLAAIDPATRPSDFARPGHGHPLRARLGGVLVRTGQTEAAVDLARIAGLYPAGVICEIMNEDGTMARVPELTKFAKKHRLPMITVADLVKHRMRTESLVRRVATAKMPTEYGEFRIHAFEHVLDRQTHIASATYSRSDGSVTSRIATSSPISSSSMCSRPAESMMMTSKPRFAASFNAPVALAIGSSCPAGSYTRTPAFCPITFSC